MHLLYIYKSTSFRLFSMLELSQPLLKATKVYLNRVALSRESRQASSFVCT